MSQYTGPTFNNSIDSIDGNSLGHLISKLRHSCLEYYQSRHVDWKQVQVGNCVLNNLDELNQSNAASHTYFLTLWPAFISIIVAMGPDGDRIVYDDIFWSGIFTLTCGALPGYQTPSLPHQFETATLKEARRICESWQDDESNMLKSSRSGKLRGNTYASETIKGLLAIACLCLWVAFVTWYLITLKKVFYYTDFPFYYGALWYLVAGTPHLSAGMLKIALNNVELWEPMQRKAGSDPQNEREASTGLVQLQVHRIKRSGSQFPSMNHHSNYSREPQFFKQQGWSGLQTWCRIAYLQLFGKKYRILVRPNQPTFFNSCFEYFCRVGQMALFVFGCMAQGSILLVPTPTDYGLVALLVFATISPRLVWTYFWRKGKRGADIVVWFKPAF